MARITFQDLGLAIIVGTLVAISPLTSFRFWPSLLSGLIVGGGFFLYRMRALAGFAYEMDAGLGTGAMPRTTQTGATAWLAGLLFGVVFFATVTWMYARWTGSIWVNAHGVFVPFIMAYLVYLALRLDPSREPEASPWGFAFLVPGLLLLVLDVTLRTRYLAAVGLVTCLPGLSLLFLGARRTRDLALPLLVGLFMIPVPHTPATHLWLRNATAAGVDPLLRLVGIPVLRDGTVVEIPGGIFVVSDACSGFSTLYAALGLALVLAWSTRTVARRSAVLLAVVPLALISNVVRVLLLIVATHVYGQAILDTPIHEVSGVLTFAFVIVALWWLSNEPRAPRTA